MAESGVVRYLGSSGFHFGLVEDLEGGDDDRDDQAYHQDVKDTSDVAEAQSAA